MGIVNIENSKTIFFFYSQKGNNKGQLNLLKTSAFFLLSMNLS